MVAWKFIIAISLGATIGASSRWYLNYRLDYLFSTFSLGTLLANLVGGFLAGFFVSWATHISNVDLFWRVFFITGFCGSLTTFSAFSTEVVHLLQTSRYMNAFTVISLNGVGTLIMTALGMVLFFQFFGNNKIL